MAVKISLLFAAALLATVFGDLEYFQEIGVPPDEYALPDELKEILKSGKFLPAYASGSYPRAYDHPRMMQPKPLVQANDEIPLKEHNIPSYDTSPTRIQIPFRNEPKGRYDLRDVATYDNEQQFDYNMLPEFFYDMPPPVNLPGEPNPFAVPPVDPRYYQQVDGSKSDLKRAVKEMASKKTAYSEPRVSNDVYDVFEEPRQQRQNPNLAATKINKIIAGDVQQEPVNYRTHYSGKFGSDRDIPTSLVPTSPKHQHVIQQALKNSPGYEENSNVYLIYIYAMVAGITAAATVAIGAFVIGWYTMRKKSKAAVDVEYPAYGITGPNTEVTPSGDRQLAHSAQMYHYQHQKQQIIAMESRGGGGIPERHGSVSDAESEDENDEGDYTVYECPGFATTGEMEVKNPLFLDEPTPATPAQQPTTVKK